MEYYYKTRAFQLSLINSIVFIILFSSCTSDSISNEEEVSSLVDSVIISDTTANENQFINLENETYSYQTIFDPEKGWGYQILKGDKVYINQPHIPAISGTNGFSSEENAQKTAEFAIHKIDNGIMPPTLSKLELDSLGVLDGTE